MPIPVEAIQGFLIRADLKFATNDQGANGQFMLSFETHRYVNPSGEKSLMLLVTVAEDGGYLEIAAVNMYSANDAKDIGKLCEFLMSQNFATKLLRWELDRSDNEVRATVEVAPLDGSITFNAFMRMLMTFPIMADGLHPMITKVMSTAKLPPPARVNKRLRDLVRRAGGIAALEKIISSHEQATRESLTIDQDLARKLGLEAEDGNPVSSPDAVTPVEPPRIDQRESDAEPGDDFDPDDGPDTDDDEGTCDCDTPVDGS